MDSSERPIADVLEDIIFNVQGIIRSEVRLARAEIQEETVKAGTAAGLAGSGAILAIYALGFLFLDDLHGQIQFIRETLGTK
jgi:Putative Actinobacterial Holin-X, holin superfamily III